VNRVDKAKFIEDIRDRFVKSSLVALTDFQGSSVAEMDRFRRNFEARKIHFEVVKNSLCRIAIKGTALEGLSEHFTGNTGVLFVDEDPIAGARAIRDGFKDKEHLKVRVGFFEGDVIDAEALKKVADLPGREQLLSTLLATIQEGPRSLLRVIQAPARDLLYVLNNFADKLERDGAA
jgi:large subunit ribosomal protein L10